VNKQKIELYKFLRIIDKFGIGDLTANHASVLSSDGEGYFINKHKYLFSQINPNNLNYVNLKDSYSHKYKEINKAGFHIHKYLHLSKSKPKAILHTHTINSVAISCLKNGFNEKLNQSSMRFFKKIKYFKFNGMVIDENEGLKLKKLVNKETSLIILKNHGVIIIAKTIDELFHLTFHFEKCANIQLKIGNRSDLSKVNNIIASQTSKQHSGFGKVGEMSWRAIKKKYKL
tara:strand:+ start:228 stop:917 length:690 start_codon:yes stop_codon:yes gene_type:complete